MKFVMMKYIDKIGISTLLIFIFLLLAADHGLSQEKKDNNIPALNNHFFMPHTANPEPFINSHFGMTLGAAFSNDFQSVILEIDGDPLIGIEGSILFADLKFEYQQKVKDWIALYTTFGLTARIGTELQSLLAQGVNAVTTFRLGWLFKLAEGEKYILSGNVEVNNHNGNFVNLGQFIEDILTDTLPTSITRKVPSLNALVGLKFAYGFNDLFGLRLNFDTGFGESFERGSTSLFYNFGGIFDINLANRTKVPLGVGLNLNFSTLPDIVHVDNRTASLSGLKIAFMGAEHYVIGLETLYMKVPIPNVDDKITSTGILLTSKFYFN